MFLDPTAVCLFVCKSWFFKSGLQRPCRNFFYFYSLQRSDTAAECYQEHAEKGENPFKHKLIITKEEKENGKRILKDRIAYFGLCNFFNILILIFDPPFSVFILYDFIITYLVINRGRGKRRKNMKDNIGHQGPFNTHKEPKSEQIKRNEYFHYNLIEIISRDRI